VCVCVCTYSIDLDECMFISLHVHSLLVSCLLLCTYKCSLCACASASECALNCNFCKICARYKFMYYYYYFFFFLVCRMLKKMQVLAIHSKLKHKRNKIFEKFRSLKRYVLSLESCSPKSEMWLPYSEVG